MIFNFVFLVLDKRAPDKLGRKCEICHLYKYILECRKKTSDLLSLIQAAILIMFAYKKKISLTENCWPEHKNGIK